MSFTLALIKHKRHSAQPLAVQRQWQQSLKWKPRGPAAFTSTRRFHTAQDWTGSATLASRQVKTVGHDSRRKQSLCVNSECVSIRHRQQLDKTESGYLGINTPTAKWLLSNRSHQLVVKTSQSLPMPLSPCCVVKMLEEITQREKTLPVIEWTEKPSRPSLKHETSYVGQFHLSCYISVQFAESHRWKRWLWRKHCVRTGKKREETAQGQPKIF